MDLAELVRRRHRPHRRGGDEHPFQPFELSRRTARGQYCGRQHDRVGNRSGAVVLHRAEGRDRDLRQARELEDGAVRRDEVANRYRRCAAGEYEHTLRRRGVAVLERRDRRLDEEAVALERGDDPADRGQLIDKGRLESIPLNHVDRRGQHVVVEDRADRGGIASAGAADCGHLDGERFIRLEVEVAIDRHVEGVALLTSRDHLVREAVRQIVAARGCGRAVRGSDRERHAACRRWRVEADGEGRCRRSGIAFRDRHVGDGQGHRCARVERASGIARRRCRRDEIDAIVVGVDAAAVRSEGGVELRERGCRRGSFEEVGTGAESFAVPDEVDDARQGFGWTRSRAAIASKRRVAEDQRHLAGS